MMRQGRTLLSLMLTIGVFAPMNAVERTLIDFSTYNDNIAQVIQKDQELYNQLIAENPEMDKTEDGYPELAFKPEDWNIENWKVVLNSSSAASPENVKVSKTRNTPSQKYGNVLGLRLHFKPWINAFWAEVKTPFHFYPVYPNGQFVSQDENNQDNGLAVGLLVNVGQIQRVRSWVYGLNYKYNYGIRVRNEKNQLLEFSLGSTFHEGWRRHAWVNPFYLENPADWTAFASPLYPFTFPFVKFDSLNFYKPYGDNNPTFIGYVKDITMDFDYAVIREESDINDEAVWQILADDAIKGREAIYATLAEELRFKATVEKLKGANEAANKEQQQQNNAAATEQQQ